MNWYLKVLKQYVDFSGRARRKEYWMFTLFNVIIMVVLSAVDGLVFGSGSFAGNTDPGSVSASVNLGVLTTIYVLAVLLPSLAVSVRRLHDTDRSGWWLLILLVPLIGAIVFLVFMLLDSQPGENRHGPSPKYAAA
jgi:uncharacterized membrane protein YhaH (DUF805 family)